MHSSYLGNIKWIVLALGSLFVGHDLNVHGPGWLEWGNGSMGMGEWIILKKVTTDVKKGYCKVKLIPPCIQTYII